MRLHKSLLTGVDMLTVMPLTGMEIRPWNCYVGTTANDWTYNLRIYKEELVPLCKDEWRYTLWQSRGGNTVSTDILPNELVSRPLYSGVDEWLGSNPAATVEMYQTGLMTIKDQDLYIDGRKVTTWTGYGSGVWFEPQYNIVNVS